MAIQNTRTGSTFAGDTTMEVTICTCGVLFAVPERLLRQRREDGKSFYCPHGHSLSYHETESDRLKQRLKWESDRAARNAARADQAEANARGQKAAKTRIKNQRDRERTRVGNGVCPCCNRSFQNLRRHMESQHPDHAHDHAEP